LAIGLIHLFRYFFIIYFISLGFSFAQQYPYWSQYRSSSLLLNPAVAGSRKKIDARLSYRNQWVGFEGAPKTMSFGFHSRFYKNNVLGAGGYVFQDVIGPFKYVNIGGSFAYHAKFDDAKLSIGVGGSYQSQGYNTSKITTQFRQDPAVDYSYTETLRRADLSFGLLYYNDRFYIGLAGNNLLGATFEYYKQDTTRKAIYKQVNHFNFALGYNWMMDESLIWENSFLAGFVSGAPMLADYTLRLHFKEQLIIGLGYRFKTAAVFQLGYTILNTYQICYSYDLSTNRLKTANSGTHELKLVFSSNLFEEKGKGRNKEFQRQKFQYLF
jgi:type IX secretion system PorP/SprF family membrane protein